MIQTIVKSNRDSILFLFVQRNKQFVVNNILTGIRKTHGKVLFSRGYMLFNFVCRVPVFLSFFLYPWRLMNSSVLWLHSGSSSDATVCAVVADAFTCVYLLISFTLLSPLFHSIFISFLLISSSQRTQIIPPDVRWWRESFGGNVFSVRWYTFVIKSIVTLAAKDSKEEEEDEWEDQDSKMHLFSSIIPRTFVTHPCCWPDDQMNRISIYIPESRIFEEGFPIIRIQRHHVWCMRNGRTYLWFTENSNDWPDEFRRKEWKERRRDRKEEQLAFGIRLRSDQMTDFWETFEIRDEKSFHLFFG